MESDGKLFSLKKKVITSLKTGFYFFMPVVSWEWNFLLNFV